MGVGTICEPWASEADLCQPCTEYETQLMDWIPGKLLEASELLYEISGRQFPGLCTKTIRPAARPGPDRMPSPSPLWDALPDWIPAWGFCGCDRQSQFGCSTVSSLLLPNQPVHSVDEVKVDGEVLDPADYRLDNHRLLTRMADADGVGRSWPCCQRLDLPDTEVGTWSVTTTWGKEPPASGVTACAVLACELAMACVPDLVDKCRLPKQVQSITRQGVTMIMAPSDFLTKDGRIGIYEVDLFVRAFNPTHQRRNASVMSPDMPSSRSTAPSGS